MQGLVSRFKPKRELESSDQKFERFPEVKGRTWYRFTSLLSKLSRKRNRHSQTAGLPVYVHEPLTGPEKSPAPTADLPLYVHEPLAGPEKIRILRLYPTKHRLECSIEQVDVSDGGYSALSYVWGSEERPFRAVVRSKDGSVLGYIPLTENLRNALGDLRGTEEVKSKTFWIDQICINQDGEEKNHQVAMMGRIFEGATRVITYLGPAINDEHETRATDLLHQLYQHFAPNYQLMHQLGSLWHIYARQKDLPVREGPAGLVYDGPSKLLEQHGWKRLVEIVCGDWMGRLWIVQEQLLNRHGIMLRGPRLLAWDEVVVMPLLFYFDLLPQALVRRFSPATLRLHIVRSLHIIWQYRAKLAEDATSFKLTLLENVEFFDSLDCRDPRDRIYALLSISSSNHGIVPEYSESKSIHHHYHQVSVSMLCTDAALNRYMVLASRWYDGSGWAGASWALKPSPPTELSAQNIPPHKVHPYYSHPQLPRFRSNHSVLVLRGRCIDTVATSACARYGTESIAGGIGDNDSVERDGHLISDWSSILCHCGVSVSSVASLCRVIICERDLPSNYETFHAFVCYIRQEVERLRICADTLGIDISTVLRQCNPLLQKLQGLDTEALVGESGSSSSPASSFEQTKAEIIEHNKIARRTLIRGRSFCVTNEGRLCNAMHDVEAGDAIVALAGIQRLYVLRPAGDKYRLVGEAYVDGLVNGEAYEGLDPDEVDYDIELV